MSGAVVIEFCGFHSTSSRYDGTSESTAASFTARDVYFKIALVVPSFGLPSRFPGCVPTAMHVMWLLYEIGASGVMNLVSPPNACHCSLLTPLVLKQKIELRWESM